MKVLQQYVELIEQFKVKKPEILAQIGNEVNNFHLLYYGIAGNKWKTEDDAAREIFGTGKDANYKSYRALKLELKKRLQKLILLIDFKQDENFSEHQVEFYNAVQTGAVLKILIGRSKREAAKDLSLQIIDTAIEFELTETILTACKVLRGYYMYVQPDLKKFEYYQELYVKHTEIFTAENLAEEIYHEIHKYYIETNATQKFVSEIAGKNLKRLLPYKNKIHTAVFLRFMALIEILPFNTVNDYINTLRICDEYIEKIKNHKLANSGTNLTGLFHNKSSCLLMLKRYDEGLDILQAAEKYLEDGTHNWFKNRVYFVQMCLHNKSYLEAFETCRLLIAHKRFSFLSRGVQEEIMIYNAYLCWLVSIGKIIIPLKVKAELGEFRLNKFLNEINIFDKDKRGMNIPIMVLQVLFALSEKDTETFFKRLESLKKYKMRYLKDNENKRTNTFIKMLASIQYLVYVRKKIVEQAVKDFEYLKTTQQTIDNPAHELEIIPYQDVWEIIVSLL